MRNASWTTVLLGICSGLVGLASVTASPVRALERLRMVLPLLETEIVLDLAEGTTAHQLVMANPDLAELDQAGSGAVTEVLKRALMAPLPHQSIDVVRLSAGQPLFEQALLAASRLVTLEGQSSPLRGDDLGRAIRAAYREGQPHLLGVLRRLPGRSATFNLQTFVAFADRLRRQQGSADRLLAEGQPETALEARRARAAAGPSPWRLRRTVLPVDHRGHPLELVVVEPTAFSNRRIVMISHGLWDGPESFLGWAQWLASRGYTALLPVHQGSDLRQQQAMLMGDQPPPREDELRLRPLDVSATLDAVADGRLLAGASLHTDAVAMVGHSWGATTALQVAGLRTTDRKLRHRCQDGDDPDRNLSWVLQCSWLEAAADRSHGDARVAVAVAVSPPLLLLFDESSGPNLTARVLLVSGSRDWLVPPGPEALDPLRRGTPRANGHRLVLASGGGHFNLRAPADGVQPPVLGPLIEAWINQVLLPEAALRFDRGGWGSDQLPLVDVTPGL